MKLKDFLFLIQDEEARIKIINIIIFGLMTFIQTLILLNTI